MPVKRPAVPPAQPAAERWRVLFSEAIAVGLVPWTADAGDEYLPWEKFRFKTPPQGLSLEDWWHVTRLSRMSSSRAIGVLVDKEGSPFSYSLPDRVLRATETIARDASGHIAVNELVTNPDTKDRYIVNSLIEEAITSSQLEGAATTRSDAKDLLRTGRAPRDNSERMILNNYYAMNRIRELIDRPLTPDLVFEIHRIVTADTMESPEMSGRLQEDQARRVSVRDEEDRLLHQPPPVEELPGRLRALCEFANDSSGSPFMPPVLRALTIHFMVGYDHYFEDGNGRTARALFYWSMLRQGYWLTEFLSVSRILRKAPSRYAQSFLLTEGDAGDLTHFFIYHLDVIQRAISDLHAYLAEKAEELRDVQARLRGMPGEFNHRQFALVEHAVRNADAVFTIKSHRGSHRISVETARQDLRGLEHKGLLEQIKIGRQYVWRAVPHIADHL